MGSHKVYSVKREIGHKEAALFGTALRRDFRNLVLRYDTRPASASK